MYPLVLQIHSWFRWLVLLTAVWALVRAFGGWSGAKAWSRADESAASWFTGAVGVQMLLGLLLYLFLSPFGLPAFENMGETMRVPTLRFWAVEHTVGMVIGVALAHIGRARVRKAAAARKHRTAAIFFGLSVLVILLSIPWPGMAVGRPLFR